MSLLHLQFKLPDHWEKVVNASQICKRQDGRICTSADTLNLYLVIKWHAISALH